MTDRPALADPDTVRARVRAALPPYDKPVHGDTSRGMQMGWDLARQAALDALDGEPSASGTAAAEATEAVCTVTVTVHAPTGENAASWAQTISDLVSAEYGQEMRLNIQIDRPRKACCGKDIGHHIFCPTRQTKEQP